MQTHRKLRWRQDRNAFVGDQIQQVTVAADDGIGLTGDSQREELAVIDVTRGARRGSSIFMPQRQLHQRRQDRRPRTGPRTVMDRKTRKQR